MSYQPAVGNLCIAVELLLKTLIARKAFRYLFTDLPLEAQIYLSHPETVPDATAFRRYAIDLKGFKYKAPELDTCISVFYTIHPGAKPDFRPYLSLLSRVRNRSVHTALPAFEKYDLYRVAYVSLKLLQFLEKAGLVEKWAYLLTSDDKQFLAEYDAERVERVGKAIDAAKEGSKKLHHYGSSVSVEGDWELFTTECPVCGSDGFLYGSTEMRGTGEEDVSLDFDADSFKCEQCGLDLRDVEELKVAGIDVTHDRGEDFDEWMQGYADEDYPY